MPAHPAHTPSWAHIEHQWRSINIAEVKRRWGTDRSTGDIELSVRISASFFLFPFFSNTISGDAPYTLLATASQRASRRTRRRLQVSLLQDQAGRAQTALGLFYRPRPVTSRKKENEFGIFCAGPRNVMVCDPKKRFSVERVSRRRHQQVTHRLLHLSVQYRAAAGFSPDDPRHGVLSLPRGDKDILIRATISPILFGHQFICMGPTGWVELLVVVANGTPV